MRIFGRRNDEVRKKKGGHSFICDGYDGNGRFHINWGWNGSSNGYFLLNVLDPSTQGTGSAVGAYGYILDQDAIVGFQPNKGGSHTYELTIDNFKLNYENNQRNESYDNFMANVSGEFHNYASQVMSVSYGWGAFDENGTFVAVLDTYSTQRLTPGYFLTENDCDLYFGANKTSGTYYIKPIYSENGQENWRPCAGADKNCIVMTINDNRCTFVGHGTTAERNYAVNNVVMAGSMHHGRPVEIDVNLTNNGHTTNEPLYMFIDGKFGSAGLVGLEPDETGDIHYSYLFKNVGKYTLSWSWSDKGDDPIATREIEIGRMPAANLSASLKILDVSNDKAGSRTISSDRFCIVLTITNNGETTYDEDISAKMYKITTGTVGTGIQGIHKHLTLEPGETTTMQFDMTNLVDGWKYFVFAYYYSEGAQKKFASTPTYTFHEIPTPPADLKGFIGIANKVENDDGSITVVGDKFSVVLEMTNWAETTYNNDMTVRLFEYTGTGEDKEVSSMSQHLTLEPYEPATMQFDMTGVSNGHQYYAHAFYYSEGRQVLYGTTPPLTVVFLGGESSRPDPFELLVGDVNCDEEVTIADVTALVNIILGTEKPLSMGRIAADVNKDGELTIADVTALVNILLGKEQ